MNLVPRPRRPIGSICREVIRQKVCTPRMVLLFLLVSIGHFTHMDPLLANPFRRLTKRARIVGRRVTRSW